MKYIPLSALPPGMFEQVQRVKEEEGRDMSELVREALRLYMEERELRRQERLERLRSRREGQDEAQGEKLKCMNYTTTRPWPSTPGYPVTARTWTCPWPPSSGALRDYARQERLHRGPRVRGRGRERQNRQPAPSSAR